MTEGLVPFAVPDTGEAEGEAAKEAVLSGWLTTGERCRELEGAFAERVGASYAVALSSGTAALHLALEAHGVGPGDLVLTTPYTFAATGEVIRYLGAVPVFVDVERGTCNMDGDALEETLFRLRRSDRTVLPPALRQGTNRAMPKALVPVHLGGVPCDLDRFYKLAEANELAVIEDAAHALPSMQQTRLVGSPVMPNVPAAVCFSFYATKTMTTGEGGMLATEDGGTAERVRQMSLHGLSRAAWSRYASGGSWRYDIEAPGFKYNLTDIAAAVGLVQLRRLDEMRTRRAEIAARYDEALSTLEVFETPTVPPMTSSSWHLYMLRVHPDRLSIGRDRVIEELRSRGVATSVHFIPLHIHSYYRNTFGYRPDDFPVAIAQYEREISLPIYSRMTDAHVRQVCDALADVALSFAR